MSNEPLVEPLTQREQEVLSLLAEGLTAPEIAQRFTLALSSVKFHIQNIYGKLGVHSKRQAQARAAELGLLAGAQPAPTRPKHNLPLQVTRFFGREDERAQLQARLADHRLVTLTGSGGVGKSRLAIHTAEALLDTFPDGVWLVELAPLSDPALVPAQLAAVLELRVTAEVPLLEALTAYLRARRTLVLLDNCEHLLAACAQLSAALLQACPRLTLLASSREPLGVPGEAVFAVPSLPAPDPGVSVPPPQLAQFAAVRLFTDRAQLILPAFAITPENAPAVARVCQRLDGIPLALEMAAARLNFLSVDQLAARLDDVFRVLTGGSRTALPRQQTLRATLDWSYKLLSDPERVLLRRLAVFAGGCTLEAAEAVCAGEGLEAAEILDLLGSLVAKSLVLAERRAPGVRYQLLETVRQYAREKLQDSDEASVLHTRHRDYFVFLAEAVRRVDHTPAWDEPAARLADESDNVRLALEWSFADETAVEAVPLLASQAHRFASSLVESAAIVRRAVAWCRRHPATPPALFASLLSNSVMSGVAAHDLPTAIAWLNEAADISRGLEADRTRLLAANLYVLTGEQLNAGDVERALASYAELEDLVLGPNAEPRQPIYHAFLMAALSETKAQIATYQERYADARELTLAAIQIIREASLPDWSGKFRTLTTAYLGEAALDEAREALRQAKIADERLVGDSRLNSESFRLYMLGRIALKEGNLDEALEHMADSVERAIELRDANLIAFNLGLAAQLAAGRGQPARAARLIGAMDAIYDRQKRKPWPWQAVPIDTLLPGWRDGPDRDLIQAAYDTGRSLSLDAAAALALADE